MKGFNTVFTATFEEKNTINRIVMGLVVLMYSCLAPSLSVADDVLFKARYKGNYSGVNLTMERRLIDEGKNHYTLQSKFSNFFANIKESSDFQIQNNILIPQKYDYQRSIFGSKKNEALHFDWQEKTAVFFRKGKKQKEQNIDVGILDPGLYQIQLQADIFNQKNNFDSSVFSYRFLKRKKINHYEFTIKTDDTFEFNNTQYDAIRLTRKNSDNKTTHVWIVPDLDYQIGRIKHEEDDDNYEILLTEYSADRDKLTLFFQKAENDNQQNNKLMTTPANSGL